MKTLPVLALAAVVSAALAGVPAAAQERGFAPSPGAFHAFNPSESLSGSTTSPLQDQVRENYASGLEGAQRQLLQQNPSGDGRQELEIGRELNSFTPK
jgi:hypothetical protein